MSRHQGLWKVTFLHSGGWQGRRWRYLGLWEVIRKLGKGRSSAERWAGEELEELMLLQWDWDPGIYLSEWSAGEVLEELTLLQ